MGLDIGDFQAVVFGVGIVALIGYLRERNMISNDTLVKMPIISRSILYSFLILSIVIFGAYGYGYQQVDLIYAGF